MTSPPPPSPAPADGSRQRPGRPDRRWLLLILAVTGLLVVAAAAVLLPRSDAGRQSAPAAAPVRRATKRLV